MATKTKPAKRVDVAAVPEVSPEIEAAGRLIRRAIESFNQGDLESYAGLFTEDVQSYTGIHTPLRFEGLPAWKAFIEGMKESSTSVSYEQRQPSLRSFNEDAVVGNHYFVFTRIPGDGVPEIHSGRASLVCVKQGRSWRIANQHYSKMF